MDIVNQNTYISKDYFVIIPAQVRYDGDIPPNAKLLYGEIAALCSKCGYCWASNAYFAKLYGVSKRSISSWLKALEDRGHIRLTFLPSDNNINDLTRYIVIPKEQFRQRRKLHKLNYDYADNDY